MKTLIITFWEGSSSSPEDLPDFALSKSLAKKIWNQPMLLLPFPYLGWAMEEKKLDLYKIERIERNIEEIFVNDPHVSVSLLIVDRDLKDALLARLGYDDLEEVDENQIGAVEDSNEFLIQVEDCEKEAEKSIYTFVPKPEDPDVLEIISNGASEELVEEEGPARSFELN